jgi:hypothetical protein
VYVGILGQLLDLGCELGDFLAIEFVIPQNVNDRTVNISFQDPFDSIPASVDITGEYDYVSLHILRLERCKFQMEVAQDVDAHHCNEQ